MAQYQPQQTRRIMMLLMTLVVSCLCIATTTSFTPTPTQPSSFLSQGSSSTFAQYRETFPRFLVADDTIEGNPEEMIAAKIKVSGDVHGGYYRSCVTNEAGKFRRLVGRMTDPDDSKTAEIYVEGKRKMVEGFIRWCEKADKKIAMNQKITVDEVSYDEEPTGLYEGFYCKTK
jgi:acylphosphatase